MRDAEIEARVPMMTGSIHEMACSDTRSLAGAFEA
jgi:hypothetical protein